MRLCEFESVKVTECESTKVVKCKKYQSLKMFDSVIERYILSLRVLKC